MAPLDDLPPDRRAVLSLILRQGRTYDELAAILHIDAAAVRQRAHAALDELGPHGGVDLADEQRADIADFLLGQQPASQRAATRELLERSPGGRAWARVVGSELRPLAEDVLPDIPQAAPAQNTLRSSEPRPHRRAEATRSSRVGGALLLAGLGILIAVVLILVLSGGGSSKHSSPTVGSSSTPSTTGPATGTTQPQIIGQVNLTPPRGGGRTLGVANILAQAGQRALALQAQGLAPSNRSRFYAVWLFNSPADSRRLGFTPPVSSNGRLQTVAVLPAGSERYHELILTIETGARPQHPGQTVLAGRLSLPAA